MNIESEVKKRRTFAIISHPDAGKTTLTEQILKASGYIRVAGMVRAKKSGKFTISDWMDIEKERGISVSSSAIRVEYGGRVINILDTPGHEDFSEDTLRTLLAADFAVMVIDSSKGVETQTIKLFEVCSIRGIPIITFMNKLDLPSKDFLELIDEINKVLGIQAACYNYPSGSGVDFVGVYNDFNENLSQEIKDLFELTDKPNIEKFLKGEQTLIFWGSAIKNIGVQELFQFLINSELFPQPQKLIIDGKETLINPFHSEFVGFVFKIQSNIDKNYRSRTVFAKILSGKLDRQESYFVPRKQQFIKASRLYSMFGQRMETLDVSFAGDVIGLSSGDDIKLGDVITDTRKDIKYPGFPTFAPQVFALISAPSPSSRKAFDKAIQFYTDESLIQSFVDIETGQTVFGAVGKLQFDVVEARMQKEFNIQIKIEYLPFKHSVFCSLNQDLSKINLPSGCKIFRGKDRYVIAFIEAWQERYFKSNNPIKTEALILT